MCLSDMSMICTCIIYARVCLMYVPTCRSTGSNNINGTECTSGIDVCSVSYHGKRDNGISFVVIDVSVRT